MLDSKLVKLITVINKEIAQLVSSKVCLYKKVYVLEQTYDDFCLHDLDFSLKYPKFKTFVLEKLPCMDYLDYLKFKGFVASGYDEKIITRISDPALEYIRSAGLIRNRPVLDFKDRLAKLPKRGVITFEHAVKVFSNARFYKKKSPGSVETEDVRTVPKYTRKELNGKTKNDLITLCMKLQSEWRKCERRLAKLEEEYDFEEAA